MGFCTRQLDTNLDDCDYTLHQKIISSNTTIPVILENLDGGIVTLINFGEEKTSIRNFLKGELETIKANGTQPIQGAEGVKIYYKKSDF
ncbi:MAG: hypothetical protein R2784_01665 [Saprospiraceae bacterium]